MRGSRRARRGREIQVPIRNEDDCRPGRQRVLRRLGSRDCDPKEQEGRREDGRPGPLEGRQDAFFSAAAAASAAAFLPCSIKALTFWPPF